MTEVMKMKIIYNEIEKSNLIMILSMAQLLTHHDDSCHKSFVLIKKMKTKRY